MSKRDQSALMIRVDEHIIKYRKLEYSYGELSEMLAEKCGYHITEDSVKSRVKRLIASGQVERRKAGDNMRKGSRGHKRYLAAMALKRQPGKQ